mmetsp:Transcript_9536/g.29414  ORF Transcript_9536/g.29414 Transcript_9536/m.29414 type:complete len:270 (-) Transcript_9536:140-949(-)|eukprot:CAMPEP_0177660410 /NCGR_PEP_ID=MMETSP0447-20121125/18023_1 /TAXON_ID=0 /ORGANISM="Stygamoeba regulata, Strain BSH-02190019" /LENGTH=269 /DNA_ID=CAMNT_0019165469 /DNA_START=92 /DNA_END=901 /DNA_ORIENTATION=-
MEPFDPGLELSLFLFSTALNHYRRFSVCNLPPSFLASPSSFEVAFDALHSPQSPSGCQLREFLRGRLQLLSAAEARGRLPTFPWTCEALRPTQVYAVSSPQSSTQHANDSFEQLGRRHGTVLAYHGSALENFHSILTRGLQPGGVGFGEPRELYGAGIYFSTELSVAHNFLNYSTAEPLRRGRMACLAVCEIVREPDVVREPSSTSTTLSIHSSEELPQTYLVVSRASHVRVRYLLVYDVHHRDPILAICSCALLLLLLILWRSRGVIY